MIKLFIEFFKGHNKRMRLYKKIYNFANSIDISLRKEIPCPLILNEIVKKKRRLFLRLILT